MGARRGTGDEDVGRDFFPPKSERRAGMPAGRPQPGRLRHDDATTLARLAGRAGAAARQRGRARCGRLRESEPEPVGHGHRRAGAVADQSHRREAHRRHPGHDGRGAGDSLYRYAVPPLLPVRRRWHAQRSLHHFHLRSDGGKKREIHHSRDQRGRGRPGAPDPARRADRAAEQRG